MAYRVKPDGTIECDGLDEAIALSKRMVVDGSSAKPEAPKASGSEQPTNGDSAKLKELVPTLTENQQVFLRSLRSRRRASLEELRESMSDSLNGPGFSGVVAGVIKNLKREGIRKESVFTHTVTGNGAQRVSIYDAGPLLLRTEL